MITKNSITDQQKLSIGWIAKLNKQRTASNEDYQNLLQNSRSPYHFINKLADYERKQIYSLKKHGQNERQSDVSHFHENYSKQTPSKCFSQSKEQAKQQKNLKIQQLIQQICTKLTHLANPQNRYPKQSFRSNNTEKIINEIKMLLNNVNTINQYEYIDQQIAKNRKQIKLLEAENYQLKIKLEKNAFLDKKNIRDFVPKQKYEKLKQRYEEFLSRNKRNLQAPLENYQGIEDQILTDLSNKNTDLQLQDHATVIAQQVARIYLELHQIIKDNNLSNIFCPKQLSQIDKKVKLLLDSNIYEKIRDKIKLTKTYHLLPQLTEYREAELHLVYQSLIEKLVKHIQKTKEKCECDFESTMKRIVNADSTDRKFASNSEKIRFPDKRQRSRKSTAEDNRLGLDESFNSETLQAYHEKIKKLELEYDELSKKSQDLEAQLQQKNENNQIKYIYELVQQIACFLPLQDTQITMFRPQNDADCISILYEIRFFAKKYEEKQKQMDIKVEQFEQKMICVLKQLIEQYNIPKNQIMKQVDNWYKDGNLRNLIHQYYQSKSSPEKKRHHTLYEMYDYTKKDPN